jgi:acyl-coenzyme A synthetase/AMP-(fatty) acid ligase
VPPSSPRMVRPFVGRQTEMIIRGGANISPAEIESALCAHTDVVDAVIVGLPDSIRGGMVVALVVLRTGLTSITQSLEKFLGDSISSYKIPSVFLQVEAIPTGTTGKKNRAAKEIARTLLGLQ